jgi:hypothetical protein
MTQPFEFCVSNMKDICINLKYWASLALIKILFRSNICLFKKLLRSLQDN